MFACKCKYDDVVSAKELAVIKMAMFISFMITTDDVMIKMQTTRERRKCKKGFQEMPQDMKKTSLCTVYTCFWTFLFSINLQAIYFHFELFEEIKI